MTKDVRTTSTRPYLIRALHEWCGDNGLTPFVTVLVDNTVQVPREFVKDGEIVLNIGFDATTGLQLGNDFLEFKARFGGVVRDIFVPVDQVVAIFAKENGQGMAFPRGEGSDAKVDVAREEKTVKPAPTRLAPVQSDAGKDHVATPVEPSGSVKPGGRPSLTRIK
jgi:stringent starvation protein B